MYITQNCHNCQDKGWINYGGHPLAQVFECCECNPEELSEEIFTKRKEIDTLNIEGGDLMNSQDARDYVYFTAIRPEFLSEQGLQRQSQLRAIFETVETVAEPAAAPQEEVVEQPVEEVLEVPAEQQTPEIVTEEAPALVQSAPEPVVEAQPETPVENVTEEVPTVEIPVEGMIDSSGVETVVEEVEPQPVG